MLKQQKADLKQQKIAEQAYWTKAARNLAIVAPLMRDHPSPDVRAEFATMSQGIQTALKALDSDVPSAVRWQSDSE